MLSTSAHLVKKFSSRCYQHQLILSVIGLGKGRLSDRSVSDRRSKIRIRIRMDETCNEGHLVFDWAANLNTTIIPPKAIKHYKTKITNKKGKTCSIGCFVFDWPGTFYETPRPQRPFIFSSFPHFQRILFIKSWCDWSWKKITDTQIERQRKRQEKRFTDKKYKDRENYKDED